MSNDEKIRSFFSDENKDLPPPTGEQLRNWKYGKLPRPKKITSNSKTSNARVIAFETSDDQNTMIVASKVSDLLVQLRKEFLDLTWNDSEAAYRTRWTRFQMIGDLSSKQ